MNSAGKSDGHQKVWVKDDKDEASDLVIDVDDIKFRVSEETSIRQLDFITFHGGKNEPEWQPSKDQSIWFAYHFAQTPNLRLDTSDAGHVRNFCMQLSNSIHGVENAQSVMTHENIQRSSCMHDGQFEQRVHEEKKSCSCSVI